MPVRARLTLVFSFKLRESFDHFARTLSWRSARIETAFTAATTASKSVETLVSVTLPAAVRVETTTDGDSPSVDVATEKVGATKTLYFFELRPREFCVEPPAAPPPLQRLQPSALRRQHPRHSHRPHPC